MGVKAVVFDLDDTLFPEVDYVKSGYKAVAELIKKEYGIENAQSELWALFEQMRENVFDRYMQSNGLEVTEQSVGRLVEAYRTHKPDISLSDGVRKTLIKLRENGYKLGIITDGRPQGQRLKIDALELNGLVDKIIITDELGGTEFRKPDPKAFEIMCGFFNIAPQEMMYIGDNPKKDFAVKQALPIKTVHVASNGLYKDRDYAFGIKPDFVISEVSCAILDLICKTEAVV